MAEESYQGESQAFKESLKHLGTISTKLSEMRIVSSEEVHKAALAWFEATNKAIGAEGEDYLPMREAMTEAHDNFVESAAQELGVKRR